MNTNKLRVHKTHKERGNMMIQLINKMKRKDGFTLVELIVVLVILAILAAFTIPAMLGYINDAREKADLAEARAAYIAAQATVDNIYGPMTAAQRGYAISAEDSTDPFAKALIGEIKSGKFVSTTTPADTTFVDVATAGTVTVADVVTSFNKYASGDLQDGAAISGVKITTDGQITDYVYNSGSTTCTFSASGWKTETN